MIRLRLAAGSTKVAADLFGQSFDDAFAARLREADEFYKSITPASLNEDQARVMRQALAGMLWGKQHYFFDADKWLAERSRLGSTVATAGVDGRGPARSSRSSPPPNSLQSSHSSGAPRRVPSRY